MLNLDIGDKVRTKKEVKIYDPDTLESTSTVQSGEIGEIIQVKSLRETSFYAVHFSEGRKIVFVDDRHGPVKTPIEESIERVD